MEQANSRSANANQPTGGTLTSRLRLAMRMAKVVAFEFDYRTGLASYDPPGSGPAVSGFRSFEDTVVILPNDSRAEARALWRQHLLTGETFALEYPWVRPDGEVGWHMNACEAVKDANGDVIGLIGMRQDITDRRRAELAVIAEREAARAADEAKSVFLANMSHEIRTPLNGVLGVVSMLARSTLTPQQKDMVGIIEASSRTLQVLLDDLLDIAKIEAGLLELSPHMMLPADIANHLRGLFEQTARNKGVSFNVVVDEGAFTPVLADRTRLAQILTNLCSNALKFTNKGGVTLSISTEPDGENQCLRVAVQDTGIGISETGRRRLFERFSQADGSITRRFGGTGLGLAISQELAHLMGGEISLISAPGVGSTFTLAVRFPRVAVGDIETEETGPSEPSLADLAAAGEMERMRVLLVEDHPVNRQVVEMMLADIADVTVAENGLEGVQVEARSRFDLILMDMQMPVMDGLTATKLIREREAQSGCATTPIIVLTANVLNEHVQACLEAGASSHLSKPITVTTLLKAMANVLVEEQEASLDDSAVAGTGCPGRALRPEARQVSRAARSHGNRRLPFC